MSWDFGDTEEVFLALANLVGPDAIRRKMQLLQPDPGKPLGKGLNSKVQIIGGWIRYEDHVSNHPLLNMAIDDVNGLQLPITGGSVSRAEDGRLHAKLHTAKAMPMLGELSELLEVTDGYDFYASDALVSTDQEQPTIFQNLIQSNAPVGTKMKVPGLGTIAAPFGFRFAATTEAVGFVEHDVFKGTMALDYQFAFVDMPVMVRAALESQFGPLPLHPQARGGGLFEVQLLIR